jgi:hypothetical protein
MAFAPFLNCEFFFFIVQTLLSCGWLFGFSWLFGRCFLLSRDVSIVALDVRLTSTAADDLYDGILAVALYYLRFLSVVAR